MFFKTDFLGSKQQFADWIKERIKKYGFIEGQDYVSLHKIMKREIGATTQIEYEITIDMAKELSMVEGSSKGKQARRYFIACEKALKQIFNNQLRQAQESAQRRFIKSNRIREIDATLSSLLKERKELVKDINFIDRMDFRQLSLEFVDKGEALSFGFPNNKRRLKLS
ncbi:MULTISPECIES: antA/AntB antirepressor family protein [unclassified Parabacteroides]|uniref:antA/AntB antirepressor family protein n=1 Tax=unclassified Parabacteroides TaxID=2649774 RepID=UPI0024739A1F|nr:MULTISPECIES: antA/AntB antirepressor family protein [unclassified Parabacteroides]